MSIDNQGSQRQRGRKEGSKNARRELPATIHPEQRLTIEQMAILSNKSLSFFYTNMCLAKAGRKHTPMPPVRRVGRNVVCRAADFFA